MLSVKCSEHFKFLYRQMLLQPQSISDSFLFQFPFDRGLHANSTLCHSFPLFLSTRNQSSTFPLINTVGLFSQQKLFNWISSGNVRNMLGSPSNTISLELFIFWVWCCACSGQKYDRERNGQLKGQKWKEKFGNLPLGYTFGLKLEFKIFNLIYEGLWSQQQIDKQSRLRIDNSRFAGILTLLAKFLGKSQHLSADNLDIKFIVVIADMRHSRSIISYHQLISLKHSKKKLEWTSVTFQALQRLIQFWSRFFT